MQTSKLVVASLSCAELGTAQPQLVIFILLLLLLLVDLLIEKLHLQNVAFDSPTSQSFKLGSFFNFKL